MVIKGVFDVDGVRLVIDIDVPDGETHVCVTNVSSRCLVIPRERWPLDLLDLDAATLGALTSAGLKTVGDVVDDAWIVNLQGEELQPFREMVQSAVERLRSVALSFAPESQERRQHSHPRSGFPIAEQPEQRLPPGAPVEKARFVTVAREPPEQISPDTDLINIGVPQKIAKILADKRVTSVGQLLSYGRTKLVMTPKLTGMDVRLVEAAMHAHNVSWPS